MNFTTITNTLNARLNALSSKPPIAWPNVPYTPTNGTLFLRVSILPANTETITLDSAGRHTGIYQVSVFAENGKGELAANQMADKVADHFAANRDLNGLRIREISQQTAEPESAWYQKIVSITYDTHHTR